MTHLLIHNVKHLSGTDISLTRRFLNITSHKLYLVSIKENVSVLSCIVIPKHNCYTVIQLQHICEQVVCNIEMLQNVCDASEFSLYFF